jgi:hypothetical protein
MSKLIKLILNPYLKDEYTRYGNKYYTKDEIKEFIKSGKRKKVIIQNEQTIPSPLSRDYVQLYETGFLNNTFYSGKSALGINLESDDTLLMNFLVYDNSLSKNKYQLNTSKKRNDGMSYYKKLMFPDYRQVATESFTFALECEHIVAKGKAKRNKKDIEIRLEEFNKHELIALIKHFKFLEMHLLERVDVLIQELEIERKRSLHRYRKWFALKGLLVTLLGLPNKEVDALAEKVEINAKVISNALKAQQKKQKQFRAKIK